MGVLGFFKKGGVISAYFVEGDTCGERNTFDKSLFSVNFFK
jgi:hypothetical protein